MCVLSQLWDESSEQAFSTSALLTFGQSSLCGGDRPVHCGCSSTPGLSPLGASSSPLHPSCDNEKQLQTLQMPPGGTDSMWLRTVP